MGKHTTKYKMSVTLIVTPALVVACAKRLLIGLMAEVVVAMTELKAEQTSIGG